MRRNKNRFSVERSILNLPKTQNVFCVWGSFCFGLVCFFVNDSYLFRKDEYDCMGQYLPVIIWSLFKGLL